MAAVMMQAISRIYASISKNRFFASANKNEEYIICKEYCTAHHDYKLCFLPNCRYRNLLIGAIDELPEKLNAFCHTYQHVDCFYTLFKYRFSIKFWTRVDRCLIMCKEQSILTEETGERTRFPILKKWLLRKKYKKHFLISFQQTNSTQTTGQVFADWTG